MARAVSFSLAAFERSEGLTSLEWIKWMHLVK
jgi:hypothetical protein